MHRMIAAVVLFVCVTLARPVAQTRESPLSTRDLPRPPKWTKYVPPVVTAQDVGGQPGLVMLELLIDPSGKVAEAKVQEGPPSVVAAALAAAKQWEYEPTIVNGKGAWIRIVSSITIRPLASAADAAAATPQGGPDTVNHPASAPSPVETVNVSTGASRASGGPVTLVTREGQGSLRQAFLIAYQTGSRQAISFSGPARVLSRPGNQLAVLPATGQGWVFLPPNATWAVTDATRPPAEVRILRITRVSVGTARSHQQLAARLMRVRRRADPKRRDEERHGCQARDSSEAPPQTAERLRFASPAIGFAALRAADSS